jgi:hypothetical protein
MAHGCAAFVFAIPLRSRATARDWRTVCDLLDHTLRSVLRQDDEDFSVLLACHETPDTPSVKDPRVTILQTDCPIPTTFAEQMFDKHRKKRICTAELKQRGGGYIMFMDADDMVSRRLVSYVRRRRSNSGYIITKGYQYNSMTQRYCRLLAFDKRCGSCGIFQFSVDDLPETPQEERETFSDQFGTHTKWREVSRKFGRALEPIGFPSAVHVLETGENASAIQPRSTRSGLVRVRRKLLETMRVRFLSRSVDDYFRNEFGIPWTPC